MNREGNIHPSASVSEQSRVGKGTNVWQNCIVMDGAVIGEDCSLGANVFVERDVIIGNRVKVKNNVAIYSGVVCEDDVFLGPNCVFTNVTNPRSFVSRKTEFQPTIVKKGASIGANATIVCGNTIGSYAMVGAGAVVTKDVPPYALVMGNPARFQGCVCKCGTILCKERDFGSGRIKQGEVSPGKILICPSCKNQYRLEERKLISIQEG